jgi:DNA-binding PadR family transcriptional regulator
MSLHIFHLTDEGGSGRGDSPRGRRCRTFGSAEHGPGQHGPGHHAAFGAHPFGGFAAGGGPRGRGRKARRGDIRTAALLLLAEEPRNGYQIMQEVQERSDGVWRPSAGSVYPALQQLEDEGLIRSEEHDGRKLFALTDAGRDFLSERGSERPAPWAQMGGDVGSQARELGKLMREVGYAFAQVIKTGGEGQMAKAHEVLAHARRDLYRILADGDTSAEGPAAGPAGSEGDG